jgi:hypothetical protein
MQMHRLLLLVGCFAGGVFSGCGPATAVAPPSAGDLHGGVLVPLTDSQGYVELLNDKREVKAKQLQMDLVAYVLESDRKTAMAEAPTSVEVKIQTSKGEKAVKLQPSPDASDPVGSRRYTSGIGPYELTQTAGEVTVGVGGKTLTGTFRGPR